MQGRHARQDLQDLGLAWILGNRRWPRQRHMPTMWPCCGSLACQKSNVAALPWMVYTRYVSQLCGANALIDLAIRLLFSLYNRHKLMHSGWISIQFLVSRLVI